MYMYLYDAVMQVCRQQPLGMVWIGWVCFVLFVFWTTQAVHRRVGSGKVAEVRVALGRRGGTDHVTCTRLQGHMSKPNLV